MVLGLDKEKLQQASWRGFKFLMDNVTTTGGQKTVVHEYPNSNRRTVENLGEMPDAYEVRAIINQTGNRDDYFTKKAALRAAIKLPGLGEFIHPWDGKIICAVDGEYSFTETDRELGVTVFTFRLLVSTEDILPKAATSTRSIVSSAAENARSALSNSVGEIFGVSINFPSNFQEAEELLNNAGDWMDDKRSVFRQASDSISDVTRVIDNFKGDVIELIDAPAKLGTDIIGMYQSVTTLFTQPAERLEALKQFFGFGDDFANINPDTESRIERLTNQNNIVDVMNAAALIETYDAASLVQFSNVKEIDSAQVDLENQYQKIMSDYNVTSDNTSGLNEESAAALFNLRDQSRKFLDEQRINTPRIVPILTRETSIQLLAFQYYGSSEPTEELIGLNDIFDVSFVKGNIDILSA